MIDDTARDGLENAARVSPRWVEWRRAIDIDDYDARFERMAASGADVHGEADLIASYRPASVLDAGCGTGRIAIELERRGVEVVGVDLDADMVAKAAAKAPHMTWVVDDLARMQLTRRFDLVAMPGNVMIFCNPQDRHRIVHTLTQHLQPGGRLLAGFSLEPGGYSLDDWDRDCRASGLLLEDRFATWDRRPYEGGDYHVSAHRRDDRFNVHDLLFEARSMLARMAPHELAAVLESDPALVVIDTRDSTDRAENGWIEGSVHLPRTVLEWRLDPASGYSEQGVLGFDRRIVVVCNDGYSSSMSAANLRRIGYGRATDLVGGFDGWVRAGLPVAGRG